MNLLPENISLFSEAYTSGESTLLAEISEYTRVNHPEQHMLSGHVQGKLLEMISYMIRPRRILEIGTFTGYSALCLASGLRDDGELHTIELREADAEIARAYFDRSEYRDQIILHTGNALQVIPKLQESWDLVFIDADKTGYEGYFDLVLPQVRPNGFILADNIFFHGQAFEEQPKGKNAKAIKAFNDKIRERNDIDKLVITLRDGLFLIRKKA